MRKLKKMKNRKFLLKYILVDFYNKILWVKIWRTHLVEKRALQSFKSLVVKNPYLRK